MIGEMSEFLEGILAIVRITSSRTKRPTSTLPTPCPSLIPDRAFVARATLTLAAFAALLGKFRCQVSTHCHGTVSGLPLYFRPSRSRNERADSAHSEGLR